MLMGAAHGAIAAVPVLIELTGGIGLLLQGVTQPLKDARFPPRVEAAGPRPPGTITLRQVVPRSASTENPQHAVKDATMVDGWSPRLWFLWGTQRVEPLPLRVGQVASVHSAP